MMLKGLIQLNLAILNEAIWSSIRNGNFDEIDFIEAESSAVGNVSIR